jgi:2,4-dienoyl-CoA reductase-like NADH-dependent reductase (Old Yellow Enzyme family)/thioredoxin reductase
MMYPRLFEKGKIGRLTLENRVIKAPTFGCLANPDGSVTDRLINYYEEVAGGGVGLVIVESASIDKKASGGTPGGISIPDVEHIPGLASLARAIHDIGPLAGIQIGHSGRDKFHTGQPAKAPSRVPWTDPNPWEGGTSPAAPEELTIEEIREIVAAFGDAAKRAESAGFDMVEIHGAHGMLVTNFLSPAINRRNDLYGGNLQNRMRFVIDVVRNIRSKVSPDFPLGIRLSGIDYEQGGVVIEDTVQVAKALEKVGVDFIHVSGGSHVKGFHLASPMGMPLGHHIKEAEAVKKAVGIPVIASGSITSPELAEEVLAGGKADFISIARPLFADPEWPRKAMEGRPEDIVPCIRCNIGCHERSNFLFRPTQCTVNVVLGRANKLALTPAALSKKVAIVGGGPGGMEAARVAAQRGHNVTLYERRKLGGALIEAAIPEFKADLRPLIKYYLTQMEKLKIKVIQEEATAGTIKAGKFDAAIVAVGAEMRRPDVSGVDKRNVAEVLAVLNGQAVGQRVHIVGGGMIGVEVGLFLAEQGKEIIFTTRRDEFMSGVEPSQRMAYRERMAGRTITIYTGRRLDKVLDKGAVVEDKNGNRQEIPVDSVVLASGFAPLTTLREQLERQANLEVYAIGDCVSPRVIYDAIHEGYWAARRL